MKGLDDFLVWQQGGAVPSKESRGVLYGSFPVPMRRRCPAQVLSLDLGGAAEALEAELDPKFLGDDLHRIPIVWVAVKALNFKLP